MSMDEILSHELAHCGDSFRPNELAYLALTSKIELPIRDALAFQLHTRLQPTLLVAREWYRVDLAILSAAQAPVALLELKAMYSFDDATRWAAITLADELKTRKRSPSRGDVYSLLLATHVKGNVTNSLRKIVKYHGGINRALTHHLDPQSLARNTIEAVQAALGLRNLISQGVIEGGSALGIGVDVLYWLVRDKGALPSAMD